MLLDRVIVLQSGARATGRVPEAFESGVAVVSPRVHFGTFPDSLSDGSYYCRCFLLTFVVDTLPALGAWFMLRLASLSSGRDSGHVVRVGCDSPHMLQNKMSSAYAEANAVVERPSGTVIEMAVEMSHHANEPYCALLSSCRMEQLTCL